MACRFCLRQRAVPTEYSSRPRNAIGSPLVFEVAAVASMMFGPRRRRWVAGPPHRSERDLHPAVGREPERVLLRGRDQHVDHSFARTARTMREDTRNDLPAGSPLPHGLADPLGCAAPASPVPRGPTQGSRRTRVGPVGAAQHGSICPCRPMTPARDGPGIRHIHLSRSLRGMSQACQWDDPGCPLSPTPTPCMAGGEEGVVRLRKVEAQWQEPIPRVRLAKDYTSLGNRRCRLPLP